MSGNGQPQTSVAEAARALASEAIEADGDGDAAEAKFSTEAARDLDARATDEAPGGAEDSKP